MSITKRTRFEVLRRDNHTCQYCGAKAPDVTLHMDHVIPVSLGGDDKPGNLVTACKDCNTGKASIQPDAPLVQGLSDRAAAYALGMQDKMTRLRADFEKADEFIDDFNAAWGGWKQGDEPVPLPHDYEMSLLRWSLMGIPFRAVEIAIPKAMTKRGLRGEFGVFQYMAGIVWNLFESREIDTTVTDETAAVYTESEMDDRRCDAYEHGRTVGHDAGVEVGEQNAQTWALAYDFVQRHIDNTYMVTDTDDAGVTYLTGGVRRLAA